MEVDFDADYNANIKGLYSEIVTFISRAQTMMTPEQADELFRLRAAGRDIVVAIKDTKHMYKNLSLYIVSDNQHIKEEYNKMRVHLGEVMRQIAEAQKESDDPTAVLALDRLRLEMEENDATVNGTLEHLIRENSITAEMATSLMNDSGYAHGVAKNLVQMGEALFASGDLSMKEAERELSLTDEELDEALHSES